MTDIPINDYLPSCKSEGGTCGSSGEAVLLRRDCPIHGDLAALLAHASIVVTRKTGESAKAHHGAAIAWNNITTGAADFFEDAASKILGIADNLRGGKK